MPNKKHAKEWLEKARHNLKAAEILFKANHYTDVIGIELHQAIEKTLKALPAFSNKKIEPKNTNNEIDLIEVALKLWAR